jgi:hypothetical protein
MSNTREEELKQVPPLKGMKPSWPKGVRGMTRRTCLAWTIMVGSIGTESLSRSAAHSLVGRRSGRFSLAHLLWPDQSVLLRKVGRFITTGRLGVSRWLASDHLFQPLRRPLLLHGLNNKPDRAKLSRELATARRSCSCQNVAQLFYAIGGHSLALAEAVARRAV